MNIDELAANNGLGSLVKEFKVEFLWHNYALGLLIVIPLSFVVLIGFRGLNLYITFLVILTFFIIFSGIFIVVFIVNRNKQLLIYENGFIYISNDHLIAKYEDVKEIFQEITTLYVNGIPTPTSYQYKIYIKNKIKPLYLTNIFAGIKQAGDYIQNKILQQQLPIVIDAYSRGEDVKFGSLTVNKNSIIVEKQTLNWEQIKNIRVVEGHVLLQKERGDLLLNIAAIPNIYVFLNLIYEIMAVTQPHTRTPTKGNDIRIHLKISQTEATFGCAEKEISFSRWETCDECNGSGLDNQGNNCFVCLGEGQNQVVRKIKIAIPPHSVAGDRLTITGEGDAGRRGGDVGDLHVHLEINN